MLAAVHSVYPLFLVLALVAFIAAVWLAVRGALAPALVALLIGVVILIYAT